MRSSSVTFTPSAIPIPIPLWAQGLPSYSQDKMGLSLLLGLPPAPCKFPNALPCPWLPLFLCGGWRKEGWAGSESSSCHLPPR